MTRGVIFYNAGTSCAARLAVSIFSLRKFYAGPVTVIADGNEAHELLKRFEGVDVLNVTTRHAGQKNHALLTKCCLHDLTPYDVSLYLDADTLSRGDVTPLLSIAESHEFVVPQFCNWRTTGKIVARRIAEWAPMLPGDMHKALAFGPAINTGVFAFTRGSSFMRSWFRIARRGRHLFIPDETSAQVVLHRFPHKVVEWFYNASCRYSDCRDARVRVIHYHGRKHCREGLPFHGDLWLQAYHEIAERNFCGVNGWTPAGDRHLLEIMGRTAR